MPPVGSTTAVAQGQKVPLPFAQIRDLTWSPDGTHLLVVARGTSDPSFDLYVVRTDGTAVVRLTRNVDASSADWR